MKCISQILDISMRELHILKRNPIYAFCMVVFPLATVFFFTTMRGCPKICP